MIKAQRGVTWEMVIHPRRPLIDQYEADEAIHKGRG